ncbi:MAG: DUF2238 domain-containing protein [Planctomycetaceae bacterium]
MQLLPHDRYCQIVVLLFSCLFAITSYRPPYPGDFLLQHVLTVIALIATVAIVRRYHLNRISFTAIFLFLGLHLVGARYLYSNVPYDDWARWLTGSTISERFGWERNHYDRLVHFCYGVFLAVPIFEILSRHVRLPHVWAAVLTVDIILSTSALYELMEWGVAVFLAPEAAEAYNGQQGDMWDAHKDMTLAFLGAVFSVVGLSIARRAKRDQA